MSSTSVDPILAKSLAVFLLGARNDIRVLGKPTNFYMLVVGPSSITHKSTAIEKALEGIENTVNIHAMGTVEGLAEALDRMNAKPDNDWYVQPDNFLILLHDEFGYFLKASKSGYVGWKNMVDVLNSLYACKTYRFPRKKGKGVTVNGTRVSMLASITPDAFEEHVSREILEGGLMKRMLVIVPNKAPYVCPWDTVDKEMPVVFDGMEKSIKGRSPDVEISAEVKERHAEFMAVISDGDESRYGTWQRGEMNIFKIAAILAVLEREDLTIIMEDYESAMDIVGHSIGMQSVLLTGK